MKRFVESLIALAGVFIGSLLWDINFGDGIQDEDYFQAITVGLIAAVIQWGINWLHRKDPG